MSQTVSVWMAVPLHLVLVLALIQAFPLLFWTPFTLYYVTARIGTDCCIMYALMAFFCYYYKRTKVLIKVRFLSGKFLSDVAACMLRNLNAEECDKDY